VRFEFCAISAPIEAAYLRCARQDSCGVLYDRWQLYILHDVSGVPCCTTHAACAVRCFLQRELRNLRAELSHLGKPLDGHLDSYTYE
jgi:hypothetical protein